jgi:hypothetical protein
MLMSNNIDFIETMKQHTLIKLLNFKFSDINEHDFNDTSEQNLLIYSISTYYFLRNLKKFSAMKLNYTDLKSKIIINFTKIISCVEFYIKNISIIRCLFRKMISTNSLIESKKLLKNMDSIIYPSFSDKINASKFTIKYLKYKKKYLELKHK